jgi:hypothetical protein
VPPPQLLVAGRYLDDPVQEAEIDGDVGQDRPGEGRGGREHRRALDDEEDGQEQRQKAGNADDDALIERVGIDRVLVDVRIPQIDLGSLDEDISATKVTTEPGLIVKRKMSASSLVLAVEGEALAGRDGRDALGAEIGPEHARIHQPEMRCDDQPVELLVGGVGEREDRPVAANFVLRLDLDAPHDAVDARRRRHLESLLPDCGRSRSRPTGRAPRRRG